MFGFKAFSTSCVGSGSGEVNNMPRKNPTRDVIPSNKPFCGSINDVPNYPQFGSEELRSACNSYAGRGMNYNGGYGFWSSTPTSSYNSSSRSGAGYGSDPP